MATTGNIKVHGGILADQMLTGGMRFFTLSGPDFSKTLSDGTVQIEMDYGELLVGGQTVVTLDVGAPVPNSAADFAIQEILQKATIGLIGLGAEAPGATTTIDFSLDNTSQGWETFSMVDGTIIEDAATAMTNAIQALGTVTTPTGDVDLSTATVVEKQFILV